MNDGFPKLRSQGRKVVVSNEYWEIIHDAAQGGCPVSIKFFNGSKENYLVRPIHAHFSVNEPDSWANFYRQNHCTDASIETARKKDHVRLETKGRLTSEKGKILPVDYVQEYSYFNFGMVKVRLTFIVKKLFKTSVVEVSPCTFYLSGNTDMFGFRRASYPHAIPPEPAVEWREVDYKRSYKDRRPPYENYTPLYFCAFRTGVEGIEFYRGADFNQWDEPFGLEPGGAVFRANPMPKDTPFFGAGNRDSLFVENNLVCNWGDFQTIKPGRYTFDWTIGLPFVKPKKTARRHVFHACVQPRPWPDFPTLKRWSQSGVTLLRLHDDSTFVKPSWPDGLYPPYPPGVLKAMDEMIDNAHRLGMKIVPYFSLKEFHPSCPEYKPNAQAWKRQATRDPKFIACEKGPFGGYMCMKSGWLDYRKRSIELVLKKHKFDGVYYDHTWFRVCRHPEHMGGHVHSDVDEVLDFLRWTREKVGSDGYIFLHNSATPSFIGENLADLVYLGEHTDPSIPLPGRMSPDMEFVPIVPRNGIIYGPWRTDEEGVLAHALEGWPVTASISTTKPTADDFTLNLYKALSGLGLDRYEFLRAGEKPVGTGNENVYASIYYRSNDAVIFCANIGEKKARAILKPDFPRIGWSRKGMIEIELGGRKKIYSTEEISKKGIPLSLPQDSYALLKLAKYKTR